MDFEVFRLDLDKALAYADGSKGGCPPYDVVLMFKILVSQTLNNLSDERTEYLINDCLSFIRFLGLELSYRVPDAPKQRNTNGKTTGIREGWTPQGWQGNPSKLSHNDRYARWTLKFTKAKRHRRSGVCSQQIWPSRSLAINRTFPSTESSG